MTFQTGHARRRGAALGERLVAHAPDRLGIGADEDPSRLDHRAGKVGDVEVKAKLAKALNAFLEPLRERRAYFLAHPQVPQDVLASGIRRMQAEAKETMRQVRAATGLAYSLDLFADEIDLFGEYEATGN